MFRFKMKYSDHLECIIMCRTKQEVVSKLCGNFEMIITTSKEVMFSETHSEQTCVKFQNYLFLAGK
jgi:hypothetical protein